MSKKIKSITAKFPIDTISFNQLTTTQIDELSEKQLQALQILAGESGKIEYEPELLKRPDGSLISEPEYGQNIIRIGFVSNDIEVVASDYNKNIGFNSIKFGLVFLPEDKHLAEKKAKMLSKHFEIKLEIDRLNAEEEWVADWNNLNQPKKYFLYNLEYQKIETYWNAVWRSDKDYMSEKTADTILKKYSQDELKQYLGIII